MKEIEVQGQKLTIRKLSKQDLEVIRNNCAEIKNGKEKLKVGTYIKYLCILGIVKADFYKTDYPENMTLSDRLLQTREKEYYKSDIPQSTFDQIYKEINTYNNVDEEQIKQTKKKS
jgi:hypothetical protein